MPVATDKTVHFSTTLFALIRESLDIRMGPGMKTIRHNTNKIQTSGYAMWFTAGVQSASLIMTSLMTS